VVDVNQITPGFRVFARAMDWFVMPNKNNSAPGVGDCHLGCYFKRPKSSLVRPLARNWYYGAQFIAKPKAACALRFSWAAASNNRGL